MRTINHWISGAETGQASDRRSPVFNPATGEQEAEVLLAGVEEVNSAVQSAAAALEEWAETSLSRRTGILFAFGSSSGA